MLVIPESRRSPAFCRALPTIPSNRGIPTSAIQPVSVARPRISLAPHPDFRGAPSNGNRLDGKVAEDFLADPAAMYAMAARIRELLSEGAAEAKALPDLDADDTGAGEGGLALRAHLRSERDPRLRRRKIADARRRGLPIACEVCTFE